MSRIALVLPELEVGGAQRVMLLLAREFSSRGYRVDLLLLRDTGPLMPYIPDGACLVNLGDRGYGICDIVSGLSSLWRLMKWLKREQPDSILSTITGANLIVVLARKVARVKSRLVIREAGNIKNLNSHVRLAAMRWLYPRAHDVIALSPVMALELIKTIRVSPDRVHFIPNPVDTDFICEQGRAPLEHPWLNDAGIRVVISVGRLIPEKDYVTLLEAFALLPKDFPVRLIIVGKGPEYKMLESLLKKLSLEDRAQFVGFDINPWRWMARADLFVLSSKGEGCPNVLLEALALGLPAVVSAYDNSVIDMANSCGIKTVPVGNPRALADEIENSFPYSRFKVDTFTHPIQDIVNSYLSLLTEPLRSDSKRDS